MILTELGCLKCLKNISVFKFFFWLQIHLTRTGSRGHHRGRRAREPEPSMVVETGANEERKVIGDLRPFSHYDLAVRVFNSKGEGPLSEALSFKTDEGGKKWRGKTGVDGESWKREGQQARNGGR